MAKAKSQRSLTKWGKQKWGYLTKVMRKNLRANVGVICLNQYVIR